MSGWIVIANSTSGDTRAIDLAEMRRLLRNDDALLRELLELFLEFYPEYISDIRQAVMSCDSNAVRETAHRLKGSLKQIQALPAAQAAQALECVGRDRGPHQDVLFKFELLLRDVALLCDEVQTLISSE